jgi:hypothetical protein
VHDGGKLQIAFAKSEPFKPSAYSNSKAESLVGFHYEDKEFFSSPVPVPILPISDVAKVKFLNCLGLVNVTLTFQYLIWFLE